MPTLATRRRARTAAAPLAKKGRARYRDRKSRLMTKAGAVKEFTMGLGGLGGVAVAYETHPIGRRAAQCKAAAAPVGPAHTGASGPAALPSAVHQVHGIATTPTPTVNVPWHCFSDGLLATVGPGVAGLVIGAVLGLAIGFVLIHVARAGKPR